MSPATIDKPAPITLAPDQIDIASFPIASTSTLKKWVDTIGHSLWNPHKEALEKLLALEAPRFTEVLFAIAANGNDPEKIRPLPGWSRLGKNGYEPIGLSDIPRAVVFDSETVRKSEGSPYLPFLACVFGDDGCYYIWTPPNSSEEDKESLLPKVIPFPAGRVIVGQNSCLPEETDVLTKCGWVPIKDVKKGDVVLSEKDEKSVWCKVIGTVAFKDKEVWEFGHDRLSLKATPDHRWRMINHATLDYGTTEQIVKKPAGFNQNEVTPRPNRRVESVSILHGAAIDDSGIESRLTPEETAILCWLYTDGGIDFHDDSKRLREKRRSDRCGYIKDAVITQNADKYPYNIEHIERCLNAIGAEYHKYENISGYPGLNRFRLSSEFVTVFLEKTKLDTRNLDFFDLLSNLDIASLQSFYETFLRAEGNNSSTESRTVSQNLGPVNEAFKFCCTLLGKRVTWNNTKPSGYSNLDTHCCESISVMKKNYTNNNRIRIKNKTVEDVFCLMTENSNFYVRQGKTVTLTGNCAYDRKYLSYEYDPSNFLQLDTVHIDTFCLATAIAGLSNQQTIAYKAHRSASSEGLGVPAWVENATERDLGSLVQHFCGIEISKSVRKNIESKFEADYNFEAIPADEIEYCAQDVWATFKLVKVLYGRCENVFFRSPVSWWGLVEMSQMRIHLKDFDQFLETSETEYQEVVGQLRERVVGLAAGPQSQGLTEILDYEDQVLKQFDSVASELVQALLNTDFEYFDCFLPLESPHIVMGDLLSLSGFESAKSYQEVNSNFSFSYGPLSFDITNPGTGWKLALEKGGDRLKKKLIKFFQTQIAKERKAFQKDLLSHNPSVAVASFPDLDWSRYSSGPNKNKIRWAQELHKANYSIDSRIAISLCQLLWKGCPIHWESLKTESGGTTGTWVNSEGDRLPHPDGPDKNLSSPFCSDFLVHARTGDLTSKVLTQEQIVQIFEAKDATSQWKSYRARYNDLYRLPTVSDSQTAMTTGGISPIGTVTRRATDEVFVVAPKPKESKIGSGLMNHMSVPDGFSIVGTDFDSEESWMATVLTDAAGGEVSGSPWSETVLNGKKELGTDDHSLTAATLGIPRNIGKVLNFSSAYGAGLKKQAVALSIALEKPLTETLPLAAQFSYYKKGETRVFKQMFKMLLDVCEISHSDAAAIVDKTITTYTGKIGVAQKTFETLRKYADINGIRTALLDVKIPDSLDPIYVDGKFFTSRQNWQIQSPCVDVLHTLLTLVRAFCLEYEVDYWFIVSVHDSVFFAVKEGQESLFESILQKSHKLVKQLTYEQAAKHAKALNPFLDFDSEGFKCPESQYWFSEINVGKTVSEVI